MKKWSFSNKFVLIVGLFFASQAFAAMDSWMNHASTQKPPSNTTTGCYEVSTPAQLAYFSGGEPDKCIELTADLNMEGEGNDKYFWVPIAAGGSATAVEFNGNGHIIRNLYISAEEILNVKAYKDKKYAQNLGLIGAFSGKVENVILENIQVYAYGNNFSTTNAGNPVKGPLSIGTVVGWQSGGGQVLNCYVTGTMLTIGDGQAVGGIVGNNGGGTISNCYSAVNITASGIGYVGGIAGYAKNYNGSVTISSCVYAGETLSATGEGTIFIKEEGVERYFVSQAGAIVGNHYNGTTIFENVYYDSEKFESGVGADMGGSINGSTTGTTELNSDLIACTLNGGKIQQDGSCSKEGAWSAGNEGLSLNGYGADGYKTVFNANGGSFAGGTTFVKYVKPGNVVNNDGVDDPTWGEDHAFVGWALSPDATEPENLGDPAKGKIVYAVWNPVYTITFNAAPGKFIDGKTEQSVKVERGKKISIGDEFGNPKRTDYYFRGWALNENPSVEEALVDQETGLDALPDASENRTFYAVWTEVPTYIVTFNANGHGPTISKYLEVRENQIIDGLTESEFGSAAGYVLDGWCQESECENEFVFHDTPIKEDITVYAKWDKQAYSVNYVLNCDGKCSATNASSYTVDGLALNAPSAWDEGHHFMGWSEDTEGKDVKNSIPTGETGDKTLYAIWKVDVFTITYNAGAYGKGNIIPIVQTEYGVSHSILGESFTRDGFTQDGWSTSDGSKDSEYAFSQSIKNVSLNLYPHWVESRDSVQYGAVTVYTYADKHKEAVIDGASEETVSIPGDIEVTSVTYDRSFTKGKSSTIVLPFDIDASKVGNAKFYKPSSISSDYKQISFDLAGDAVVANTPYIVIADQDGPITFEGPVTLKASTALEVSVGSTNWVFKGSYAKRQFAEGDPELGYAYGFVAKDVTINGTDFEAGRFVKAGKNAWLRPMRAYLVYNGGSEASKSAVGAGLAGELPDEINVVVQDEQGNVVERGVLNTRTGEFRMDRWYDLQGRRLKGEPKTQGTYYHNGKRVIIK